MNDHSHAVHVEEHMQGSEILTDIVIGMSDGLTVPFALAAGLSGAVGQDHINLIWIAGLAEIAAGSLAMGLGGYLAGKTEVDHYNAELKREYDEVEKVPDREKDEVKEFFSGLGLSYEVQERAVEEMTRDKDKWVDFMMKYELGLDKPDPQRARKSAFNIGFSYIVGGLIPLSPYFFVTEGLTGSEDIRGDHAHLSVHLRVFQKQADRREPAGRGGTCDDHRGAGGGCALPWRS